MDGASVRFGFPGIDELTLEASVEKMMGATTPVPKPIKKNVKQKKSFVMDVTALSDIREDIVFEEKDCLLFISAPYCKLCKAIDPGYNRMARISKEETDSDLVFANFIA
jgi:hypothetical protein